MANRSDRVKNSAKAKGSIIHDPKKRNYVIAALVVIEFIVIYLSYIETQLGIAGQWALALISLFAVGSLIKYLGRFPGWSFFYMVGSRHGIETINNISKKHDGFWSSMPLWGIVLGFGIVAYPLLKGNINKKLYAFGVISLVAVLLLVLPYLTVALQFLHIPNLNSTVASSAAAHSSGIDYEGIAFDATSIIFGFAGFVFVAILYSAANFIAIAVTHYSAPIAALGHQAPGVYPVIPGLDMPLIAGICALAILLIVHEFSHGVLARKAKVKLKSVGLLLIGVIPMGAFVEPDEKGVEKLSGLAQTKIFAAGVSANFILMIVFFALMLGTILFLLPMIETNGGIYITSTVQGYPAYGVLQPGMHVLSWDGHAITNISTIEAAASLDHPGSAVTVTTNTGMYNFTANSQGLIGVSLAQETKFSNGFLGTIIYFLYELFALSFMLNFLVGVVNLLPLPGFDGWRIYSTNIKNAKFVNFLAALILIGILLNALPLLAYI